MGQRTHSVGYKCVGLYALPPNKGSCCHLFEPQHRCREDGPLAYWHLRTGVNRNDGNTFLGGGSDHPHALIRRDCPNHPSNPLPITLFFGTLIWLWPLAYLNLISFFLPCPWFLIWFTALPPTIVSRHKGSRAHRLACGPRLPFFALARLEIGGEAGFVVEFEKHEERGGGVAGILPLPRPPAGWSMDLPPQTPPIIKF